MENSEKYYGSSKVVGQKEVDGLVEITVDELKPDGTPYKFLLTPHQYEATVLEEPYEDGKVSVKKWAATTAKILQIMMDDNLQLNDRSFVLQQLENNLDLKWQDALAKKFGVDKIGNVSLKQIDDVLKE